MINIQPSKKKTMIITGDFKRKSLEKPITTTAENALVDDNMATVLFILGMTERIDFSKNPVVTLGRFDHKTKTPDLLDLSDYGASERGVSRRHCQLEVKNNQLIVTDLGSSNGTFVSGKNLKAHQAYVLKKGEELVLGRLPIQIMSGYQSRQENK